MDANQKWDVLFIQTDKSFFDSKNKLFSELFNKADYALGEQKAIKQIYKNNYDIIIGDISGDPLEGIEFMKQLKQMKPTQVIVALVLDSDEEKIGGLIELGINTFLLIPEALDQALEAISNMNPYLKN
ncbi:response regulator [Sulfurimonas sp.]|jgi:DNA-binding NarL/FixJ family response regulator|uniref:response regulator n=1 Tax=Sulfurimonas sp. TaxID=2022749 RepID=UPI0025CF3748|nr:response regulator [Sulfurimonas sp.]MBT5933772.1 response regulator transcription factor [Sulfurimonas sp.]